MGSPYIWINLPNLDDLYRFELVSSIPSQRQLKQALVVSQLKVVDRQTQRLYKASQHLLLKPKSCIKFPCRNILVYAEGILHKISRKYCTFDKYSIHKNQVRWSPVGGLCTCATTRVQQGASTLDDLYAVSEVHRQLSTTPQLPSQLQQFLSRKLSIDGQTDRRTQRGYKSVYSMPQIQ